MCVRGLSRVAEEMRLYGEKCVCERIKSSGGGDETVRISGKPGNGLGAVGGKSEVCPRGILL